MTSKQPTTRKPSESNRTARAEIRSDTAASRQSSNSKQEKQRLLDILASALSLVETSCNSTTGIRTEQEEGRRGSSGSPLVAFNDNTLAPVRNRREDAASRLSNNSEIMPLVHDRVCSPPLGEPTTAEANPSNTAFHENESQQESGHCGGKRLQ